MTSDEELFRQWQRGNRQALESLVERYQHRLLSHLYSLVGNVKTVEDLVQETFVRLIRDAQSYQYPRPFFPWIYTIARSLAFNYQASAFHRHVELGVNLRESLAGDSELEARVEDSYQRRYLQAALAQLSIEQREVISLRFRQEMSIKDVATLLGIPEGTVKSRTIQALQRLRQYLEDTALQEPFERGDKDYE